MQTGRYLGSREERFAAMRARQAREPAFGTEPRAGRIKVGLKAMWMIGYDGPRTTPQSGWPAMMEHAKRYGL